MSSQVFPDVSKFFRLKLLLVASAWNADSNESIRDFFVKDNVVEKKRFLLENSSSWAS